MLRSSAVRPGDMRYASRQIRWIPIESIRPNPRQPRKQFDADALGELAASIRQVGLLQPITVRAIGAQGFELIAGERRLRACQQIGMAQIEAMVLPVHDGDSALMALIENLQREDLHYFEEAEGYLAIMRMHGLSQEELALRIGRSQSAVANKLRLLRLEDPVRTILCEGRLAERHARVLLRLPDAESRMEAASRMRRHGLNVRQAEALVTAMLKEQAKAAPGRHMITLVRDHRLYINAIRDIVEQMRQSGVEAHVDVSEKDDFVEVHVVMPRRKAR